MDSGRIRSAATPAPGAPDEPGPRIARWGLAISIASGVAATVAQLVDFGVYGLRIRSLDMGTHASVFGALSLLALAGSIAAAFMLLLDLGRRTLWATALPLLLAALLALRVIHPAGVLLLALPLAVATFPILWWRVGSGDAEAQCVVRLGCVALVASYAIRAVAPTVDSAFGYTDTTWPYQVLLVSRHSGELAGWAIVLTGLTAAYVNRRGRGSARTCPVGV